jgi:Gamma-glutamyl cyclotransferase, AIG2-like
VNVQLLFSYGTLRDPAVQRSVFGREVAWVADTLPGFRVEQVTAGACLELDDEQLAAADRYEVDDYVRILVEASSGRKAWTYIASEDLMP